MAIHEPIARFTQSRYLSPSKVSGHLTQRQCLGVVLPQCGALCKVHLRVDLGIHTSRIAEKVSAFIDAPRCINTI